MDPMSEIPGRWRSTRDSTDDEMMCWECGAGDSWIEYRSAVLYVGEAPVIRETGPTRRSEEEAWRDADDDCPTLHRDEDEPEVYRGVVYRVRYEPTGWDVAMDRPRTV